jgi:hypothetical protein
MAEKDKIVLGSGKLYVKEFENSIPEDSALEVAENILGYIQGGATLSYTPSFYEAKDDLGLVVKKMLTNEDVVLKSGVMTWNGKTLEKLCGTARISENENTRTVKIGGIGNYNGKKYIIRFLHEDSADGDIRITIVGSNEAGFEMAFAKDKETVVNVEFKAMGGLDTEGTLVEYKEEIKTA